VEFVRQAQVRRPFAVLQRKLEHDNDIERPLKETRSGDSLARS
jgi:hypothetical protein